MITTCTINYNHPANHHDYSISLPLDRHWTYRTKEEAERWWLWVYNEYLKDYIGIPDVNRVSNGTMTLSDGTTIPLASHVWKAFPMFPEGAQEKRLPIEEDFGLDLCDPDLQKKLLSGTFLEDCFKELQITPHQAEVFKECLKSRFPNSQELNSTNLLECFIRCWPEYKQWFLQSQYYILLFILKNDLDFPNASNVLNFIKTNYPILAEKLSTEQSPTSYGDALEKLTRKAGYEAGFRMQFFFIIHEILLAPPFEFDDHTPPDQLDKYLKDMNSFYPFITKNIPNDPGKLKAVFLQAREAWLAAHPNQINRPSSEIFARSALFLLDSIFLHYVTVAQTFETPDSTLLLRLADYASGSMKDPPEADLCVPFFRLAGDFAEKILFLQFCTPLDQIPPYCQTILWSETQKKLIGLHKQIYSRAMDFYPDFVKGVSPFPDRSKTTESFQDYLNSNALKPISFHIPGVDVDLSKEVERSLDGFIPTVINDQEFEDPDPGNHETATPLYTGLFNLAKKNPALYQMLANLRSYALGAIINANFANAHKGPYHFTTVPIKEEFKEADGKITCRLDMLATLSPIDDTLPKQEFIICGTVHVTNGSTGWVCSNPTITFRQKA